MFKKLLNKSRNIFSSKQTSVFSAASIIMVMILASRVLGLVRQRVLAHFFEANDLSLFFAAFRLPDLLFEVLVWGTFSSAFIPVFTKSLQKGRKNAWNIAGSVTNIGFLIFLVLALLIIIFADKLYGIFVPGFEIADRKQVVLIARILFAAQGFFVISYVLTAVLESLRRFLVPAIAPLFYNLGIILGTIFFSPRLGLLGPTIGVLIGAFLHLVIQLPLAFKLGFRFRTKIAITPEVKKIGKLAVPRLIEVSFLQIAKTVELSLATLISTASYTYFTFGNTIQLLPVGLFGTSIAKAALPTLTRQSNKLGEFKKTLFNALGQMSFLIIPISTFLIVLRIPIVRLIYGTDIFSWESTVQTGLVVSAFALGILFQATSSILARSFYALHDTKTPVKISITTILINIAIDFVLVKVFHLPIWGLAAAFSFSTFLQSLLLYIFLIKKIGDGETFKKLLPIIKSLVSSVISGSVMYFLLKIFDRSAWVKKLSFLGKIEGLENINFERFVLDTRYTVNLLILTVFVVAVGSLVYLITSWIFKSEELQFFLNFLKRIFSNIKFKKLPIREMEPMSEPPKESTSL
ncbi:murein biosynthesis integral membrane protein MurJ [Patescibacteria group bacterium]|nr:murein biosynthesis integral membrane protein MurJ [Patescibacteria group bacterium]MBU2036563.1 murein biosynthesis integral membrane protein MurJ [Patescibacteria group bacterium]